MIMQHPRDSTVHTTSNCRNLSQWRSRVGGGGYCRPGTNKYGRPYWCSRNTYVSEIAAPVKAPPLTCLEREIAKGVHKDDPRHYEPTIYYIRNLIVKLKMKVYLTSHADEEASIRRPLAPPADTLADRS